MYMRAAKRNGKGKDFEKRFSKFILILIFGKG
jgi:hypothetical protein